MGWNLILKFAQRRNGRDAYNALKSHFEGSSYCDLMRFQANTKMTKNSYQSYKFKFKWEDFVEIYMEAHTLYEQTGKIISESITNLLLTRRLLPKKKGKCL